MNMEKHGETIINALVQRLLDEKQINLTVEIKGIDQAEEIIDWIYNKNHPFKSQLISANWDMEQNPKGTIDKLNRILAILNE